MQNLSTNDSTYITPPVEVGMISKMLPSLSFYPQFLTEVVKSAGKAKKGAYDSIAWQASSINVLKALESVGIRFHVEGLEHIRATDGPVLFIGNHLSVMETVILPGLLLPYKPLTFVIKQSLLEVPFFKHVMASANPIAVTRTNPRQDLKDVLEQGMDRLAGGTSIVIFPQTTRAPFNPKQFSTIGIKLAKRAHVQVVPLALLTDAWENGKWVKDFGKLVPERTARLAFGAPMSIEGKGTEEHQQIIDFIQTRLARWQEDRRTGEADSS